MFLSIQETAISDGHYHAKLIFDRGATYPITVTNPFSEAEERRLEWYFEEYLRFPFAEQVKFKEIAATIPRYGEHLFKQVFADPDAYADYRQAKRQGSLNIEIVGSPAFQHLHWECLKDPNSSTPLAMDYPLCRRRELQRVSPLTVPESPILRVLLVVARPSGKNDVGYRTVSRPLVEMVQQTQLPVQMDILRPGTYRALFDHLENTTAQHGKGYYHLIHFDVHGALLDHANLDKGCQAGAYLYQLRYARVDFQPFEGKKAFLLLASDSQAKASHDLVEATECTQLLARHGIPLVVLNACQSAKQENLDTETSLASRLLEAGAHTVVAMAYSVTVIAAKTFMQRLYQQLFEQPVWSEAIRRARLELFNDKTRRAYFNYQIELEDWLLPVVYQQQAVTLPLRAFTADEETAYWEHAARRYDAPTTHYGFVGRDLDVLEIEQRLLAQDNELLIQGLGGVGKTTLLHHLAAWWQTTRFVAQVFYFGYDERAWHLQQIVDAIARQLYGGTTEDYLKRFQPLSPAAQQKKLVQALKATRHLLILDNVESITGTQLAILHTLPPTEQAALQGFLAALHGGKTLVLLGSRSEEAWLAKGTFGGNVYALSGLDPEARTELANQILQRYQVSHYRQEADFQQLMKLLAGYPLAMEVVLRNLARQSPTAVLQALTTGDEQIDFASADKTQSLLRCIEYSHSNLSADAQALLGCLAPFTGVIFQLPLNPLLDKEGKQTSDSPLLDKEENPSPLLTKEGSGVVYVKHLQRQPALAHLPFDQWDAVLKEAIHWGLLKVHPEIPVFLQIQPIFPYFLRHQFQTMPTDYQQAIQTAFRDYYDELGGVLRGLLTSKQADQKQLGRVLAQLEYENLHQALTFALAAQVSILNPYAALSNYLDTTQDHARGLQLGETVVAALQQYPAAQLQGPLGAEFVGVLDDVASQQLLLKQYARAEQTYLKNLELINISTEIDKELRGKMMASTYHQLGIVAQAQRQWEQAQDYYQQALAIFIEFNDRHPQATVYHQLGRVAQEQQQWKQAQTHYQQALAIKIEFNDRYAQASTYHQLGIVAQAQQQWAQAQDYYQQALAIYIEFNDRYEQASTYHQLGIVAQEQRQWAQAQDYYQQALAIYIEFNDRYEQARTYHQLGIVAQEQRQWAQAQDYYQQALAIFIEFNDRYEQAGTYHQLGRVAEEQEQWSEAKNYFLTALRLFVEFADEHDIGITLRNLARVYQHTPDDSLLAAVGEVLGGSEEEVREVFNRLNQNSQN